MAHSPPFPELTPHSLSTLSSKKWTVTPPICNFPTVVTNCWFFSGWGGGLGGEGWGGGGLRRGWGWPRFQQHAKCMPGADLLNFTRRQNAADQTCYITQSQYTDTGSTSSSTDPTGPGTWQGKVPISKATARLDQRKQGPNPTPAAPEVDASTAEPSRCSATTQSSANCYRSYHRKNNISFSLTEGSTNTETEQIIGTCFRSMLMSLRSTQADCCHGNTALRLTNTFIS